VSEESLFFLTVKPRTCANCTSIHSRPGTSVHQQSGDHYNTIVITSTAVLRSQSVGVAPPHLPPSPRLCSPTRPARPLKLSLSLTTLSQPSTFHKINYNHGILFLSTGTMATSTQIQTKSPRIKHPDTIAVDPELPLAPTHALFLTLSKGATFILDPTPSLPRSAMRPKRSLGLR
jgi:hypothetical protein